VRVEVYLEGPSDVFAMEKLLAPLVQRKRREGVGIKFFRARKGDGKAYLVNIAPVDAANTLPMDSGVTMVVVPDLYPKDKPARHETPQELETLVLGNFRKALEDRGRSYSDDLTQRFKVFCFKHELEALLLAVPDRLAHRLGLGSLKPNWRQPVEDQNHEHPPKQVVQALFRRHKKVAYVETSEAPAILAGADYQAIAQACPQCFQPLVAFLESCGAVA
ncbi:MAG: DUF4276 family protein, partial [Pseudomonadota bacterium]